MPFRRREAGQSGSLAPVPDFRANKRFALKRSFSMHAHASTAPADREPGIGHRGIPPELSDGEPIEIQAFELARSFSRSDLNGRWPLTSDPASGDRVRASSVETAAMIAAATMAVRKSVRVGSMATSRCSSAARCTAAAAAATPNPNVSCWTTFARVFAALYLVGGARRRT